MAEKIKLIKVGFIKPYVIPILIMFLVPGFSLWFFNHVERDYDEQIREQLLTQIRIDSGLSSEKRERALNFYEKLSIAKLLASSNPNARTLQKSFETVSTRFAI